jgi:hypothetical protein
MTKKLFLLIFFTAFCASSFAQFETGRHYAGPMLGLSFLGSTIQVGGGYEYGLEVKDFGKIGIGGIIRYWAYSENLLIGEWNYSDFLIGVQGNYHFTVPDNKFDPWAGLVLAYDAGSVSYSGPAGVVYNEPTYGGLWLGLHGGLRYWIQPNIAITSRIAFGTLGYGALEFGADFKF